MFKSVSLYIILLHGFQNIMGKYIVDIIFIYSNIIPFTMWLSKNHISVLFKFSIFADFYSLHCVGSSMYGFLTPLRRSFNCANNNSLFTRKNIVCYSTQLYFSMYKSMREQYIFVFCIYNNNAIIPSLWLQNYRGKYN